MPKLQETQVTRAPHLDVTSRPEVTALVAHPVDQLVQPDIHNGALFGLVSGLTAMNSQLNQYVQTKNTTDAHAAVTAGEDAARRTALEAADPNRMINSPAAMPDKIDMALKPNFEVGFKNVLGKRIGENIQSEALNEWAKQRMTGNAEEFIQKFTREKMSGFDDPNVLKQVSDIHENTIKAIRNDARTVASAKLTKSVTESVDGSFAGIRPDMSTQEIFEAYTAKDGIRDKGMATGYFTATEMAGKLLDHLHDVSMRTGGDPSVFQAFFGDPDTRQENRYLDPVTGKSLAELNPQLAAKADGFLKAANAAVDKRLAAGNEAVNYQRRVALDARSAAGERISDEEIKNNIGNLALFKTDNEALAFRHQNNLAVDKALAMQSTVMAARQGQLGMVEKKADREAAMGMIMAPALTMFMNGDDNQSAAAVGVMIKAQADSGSPDVNPALKNFFGSVSQQAPDKGAAPSKSFLRIANLAAQMPPAMLNNYADEDTRRILSTYNSLTQNGASQNMRPEDAYAKAYQVVSPEAKEAALKWAANPENDANVTKWVKNLTTPWYRDAFGLEILGMYPDNEKAISITAQEHAKQFKMQNPQATDDEVKKDVTGWYGNHYVYDKGSNKIVEVTGGATDKFSTEALAAYTSNLKSAYPDHNVQMTFMGPRANTYQVWLMPKDGSPGKLETSIGLGDIVNQHKFKTSLVGDEGARLAALHDAVVNGKANPEMLLANAPLLAKAQSIGAWDPALGKNIAEVRREAFKESMKSIEINAPVATSENIGFAQAKSTDRAMTDLASSYYNRGNVGQALTAMSEGVSLRSYADNKGRAIGVGYNMTMNGKNLEDDFRRAGIPMNQIEGIKDGTVSISKEQAMRLYDVAYGRASVTAQAGVDKMYGKGSWMSLSDPKKAVLVDIAYQAGTPEKFPKGVKALLDGEDVQAAGHLKVKYLKDGKMVEDTPRNNLRFSVLNGTGVFGSMIDEVARKPRSPIESAALVAQQP